MCINNGVYDTKHAWKIGIINKSLDTKGINANQTLVVAVSDSVRLFNCYNISERFFGSLKNADEIYKIPIPPIFAIQFRSQSLRLVIGYRNTHI